MAKKPPPAELPEAAVSIDKSIELAITPVMDIATAKARLAQFQEFVQGYMVEKEDYGIIPGTPKPTLLKPGADKLCEIYGLSDEYEIVPEYSREDWDRIPALFDYTVRCILRSKRNGALVATGMGSCNSYEGKYRWRDLKRVCPECGQATIIKGKEEYGGGYICWKKEGKSDGCGAKFADDDKQITGQTVGRIENDDIATLKNTILKMSKKRAKIDATLSATRSSGIFTQDMEDIAAAEAEQVKAHQAQHARGGAEKTKQAQKPGEATIQLVSAEERKAIFDVAKESGFKSKPEIMAYLLGQFGVKSTDEITATMYPKVLDALRAQGSQHPASSTNQQPVANQAAQDPAGKIISDPQKGIIHQTARRTGWEKGSGRPEDPLHQFLRREPFCVDSVAKVREDHFDSIIDALMKDPADFGFTREVA